MGQCGCGDTTVEYKFPGPAGITYGLQVYYGCRDCNTPVAVIIYQFVDGEDDDCWHEHAKPLPFMAYARDGSGNADCHLPIVSAEELRKALAAELPSLEDLAEDYENTADALHDTLTENVVADAVEATLAPWRKRT